MSLVEKLFGSFSDRELKKINPIAKQVLALEEKYAAMPDADLQAQTAVFKQQLADGKTTDDILPDAFAVCREAAWRVLGMKHFPVQVIGGIALHRGDISIFCFAEISLIILPYLLPKSKCFFKNCKTFLKAGALTALFTRQRTFGGGRRKVFCCSHCFVVI